MRIQLDRQGSQSRQRELLLRPWRTSRRRARLGVPHVDHLSAEVAEVWSLPQHVLTTTRLVHFWRLVTEDGPGCSQGGGQGAKIGTCAPYSPSFSRNPLKRPNSDDG